MKKQTIKTIVTALTAAAMVYSLTGCAGNSSGATETLNAEKSSAEENTEAAAGVEQDNEKDSVIVVMGPPQNRRQDSTRHTDGARGNMSMSR